MNFEVNEGEIFVIMGLSGSGKSTLIRLLNRLIEPSGGDIYIDGEDIAKMSKEELREVRRHKINMVFQSFGLFPHRTILENTEYGLEVRGVPKEERVAKAEKALANSGLLSFKDQYPDQLSGGMQQRVGLARALANDPEILLMDEAFSALDPLIRREMQDELLELQANVQKTIIFITHDLNEALRIGDRIALMKDGQNHANWDRRRDSDQSCEPICERFRRRCRSLESFDGSKHHGTSTNDKYRNRWAKRCAKSNA